MNDAPHPALLPAGIYDLLPPEAEMEAAVTARLMGVLTAHGYERVKPPLVEFEETLLSGAGAAMASDTFRTLDPVSHRMIGVRAELTGAGGPEADVEVIAVAGEALAAIGVPDLSVDLTLPILVPAIVEAYGIAGERAAGLRAA